MALGNVVPRFYKDWLAESLYTINNVVNQGAVYLDPNPPIKFGDNRYRMKKANTILTQSDTQITTSSTISANALTDYEEFAPVVHRENNITDTYIDRLTGGISFTDLLKPQIPSNMLYNVQTFLAGILTGLFTTSGCLLTTHSYDGSVGTISPDTILDGLQSLLGEVGLTEMDTMICHSKVYNDLLKANLISMIQAPVFLNNVITQGTIPTYVGKRVWVNDTLCAVISGSPDTYPTYVFKGQPFHLSYQQEMEIIPYKDELTAGGKQYIIWRYSYAPGFFGVSYTGSTSNPTAANLATANNWTKKASADKLIPFIRIVTQ